MDPIPLIQQLEVGDQPGARFRSEVEGESGQSAISLLLVHLKRRAAPRARSAA